jgi:Domain of unknown function (DUF4124)
MASKKTLSAVAFIAAALALTFVGSASAQLYKWTDENGKVHYSDTVPPSANDRARREIRSDGVVTKQVDRAMTPEERRAAAVKSAEEEKVRIAKEERERKDKALLVTYSSLADFDRVRDRAILAADGELVALKKQEEGEVSQRAGLQKQIDAAGKKGPSPKLKTEIEASDQELAVSREMLSRKTKDRSTLVAGFTTERARLADLIAAENAVKAAALPPPSATTAAKKK